MFIDYITLMLINLAAGLALLAAYVYFGLGSLNQNRWIPGFGVVGAIALVTGLHMTLTWPVVGSFNIAFGETTVLFGILFAGTSLALAMDWDLAGHLWIFCRIGIAGNWTTLHQPATYTHAATGGNWVHFSGPRRNFCYTNPLFQSTSALTHDWSNCVNCSSLDLCIYWTEFLLDASCELLDVATSANEVNLK